MNQRADFIIPECYIDTNLVETLVCTGGCNHQKGCNQVAKVMQEKFADRFAVGIIDADKRRPGYLNEFIEIASSEHIKLFRHPARSHFIILVHPAADGFILSCAEIANENVMSNKDPRFKRLFRSMKGTGEIKLMESLISYLADNTYQASNDRISEIFQTND